MNCKNCKKQGCSLAGKTHEMSFECKAYIGITYADLIRAEKDDARLAALLMEIRCANCAFWGICYHFADAERTIIEGKAKQECTVNLYNWLRQEVGAPGTMVSFPWGKTLEGAMSP